MRSAERGAIGAYKNWVVFVWTTIHGIVKSAIEGIKVWLAGHQDDLAAVKKAVENVVAAIVFDWQNWLLPIIRRVLPAIRDIVGGAFKQIGGFVDVLAGILTGDFGRAWDGVKAIFRGGAAHHPRLVRGLTAPVAWKRLRGSAGRSSIGSVVRGGR